MGALAVVVPAVIHWYTFTMERPAFVWASRHWKDIISKGRSYRVQYNFL